MNEEGRGRTPLSHPGQIKRDPVPLGPSFDVPAVSRKSCFEDLCLCQKMEALRSVFATDNILKLVSQVICVVLTCPISLPILCIWCLCCADGTGAGIGLGPENSGVIEASNYGYDSFETGSESLSQ